MSTFVDWFFSSFFGTVWSMIISSWVLSYALIIMLLKFVVDLYKSSRSE